MNGGRLEPPPKLGGDLSTNGSSGESLIDLYRQHKNHAPTMNGSRDRQRSGAAAENSRWIHRDKLTQIEIQEYRDRGMEVPLELLRRAGMQPWRQDERANGHTASEVPDERAPEQSVFSQQQPTTPEDDYDDEPFVPEDPRTPEEIAQSHEEGSYPYQSPTLKSSSSRIPLSTSSPLPVPIEHLERSTLLPRKRGASGNWDDDPLSYPKTRSRSHSAASQAILDEAEGRESRLGSAPSSPEKARPKIRKVTSPRAVSGPKSRNASLASHHSPNQRPGTRSGPESRPSTAVHRPEGDPPWLATMFKPDPRLPPEQQMLPTHAKRMMQEQWEREGKPGSAFDRSFTPVSVHHYESPQSSPQPSPQYPPPQHAAAAAAASSPSPSPTPSPPVAKPAAPETKDVTPEAGWPLRPPPAERKGSTTEHAGYSTMPKVQNTPPIGSLPSPRRLEPPVVTEPVQKSKEKGCGCCIVM